jgi:hypothetical protein
MRQASLRDLQAPMVGLPIVACYSLGGFFVRKYAFAEGHGVRPKPLSFISRDR